VRAFGLDVHRDFCEVAIAENGAVRSAGRIPTRVPALELFGQSLTQDDVVALEATSGADRIVAVLQGHGIRVNVANTSPAFHYEPETNGCAEKAIQVIKEQDELRTVVRPSAAPTTSSG
jgi:hypothetical protein